MLLLAGLVAYPLAVAIGYALSDRTIADPGEFTGLENFFNLFSDQIYRPGDAPKYVRVHRVDR